MGCHQACFSEFVPECQLRNHRSFRGSAKTAAQPHLSSTWCTCSSQASMLEEASFNQAPKTSTTELSCGVSRGGAGGQGGCGISILLGSAWNLPLVWKSAFGHAKGAGGATLAAHNGLTGSRCEHLTRTRRRVASASSKDASTSNSILLGIHTFSERLSFL